MNDMKRNFNMCRPWIIAEVGQAHEGSLGIAHSFIDAIADVGADAVKFQTHIAKEESTLDESFRVEFSQQDATRYAYWKRMEFTTEQWKTLAAHAHARGLMFLSSAFSVAAVHMLSIVGVDAWKVGSGEALEYAVLDAMLKAGGPIIVSTGMCRWTEMDAIVKRLQSAQAEFVLMQCTSRYPTAFEEVGLNLLTEMQARYQCLVGLSDHTGTPYPALAALSRGCTAVEIHVTFDRGMFGPDASASVTFDELALITAARNAFTAMDANPVDKDAAAERMADMRSLFSKSLAPKTALFRGTRLTQDMLTLKKPGTGIPAGDMARILGRRLRHDVVPDRLLRWEDLDA